MDSKKIIEEILEFCQEAGVIALNNQKNITMGFKDDQSVITKTDLEISALAKQKFAPYIDQGHIFIDEEDLPILTQDYYKNSLSKSEYIWAIDPLDGTHTYALHLPLWGMTVGVMKQGKPWVGILYIPPTKEIIYYDGVDVVYIRNAFSDHEEKQILTPVKNVVNNKSIFFTGTWLGIEYDFSKTIGLDCYAYVPQILWTLTNRAVGCVFGACLWDMCGSWAIAKALGFEYFNILDDSIINELSPDLFKENWKVKNPWILCRPEHYEELRSIILNYKTF